MPTAPVPSNVPVPLSAFVGREREQQIVADLLGDSRLVALTGAGGCGKTRLAREVAASRTAAHPDGVWWCELAPVNDPDLVALRLAAVLALRDVAAGSVVDTVVRHLASHRALLVFDDCEHLVDAVAAVTERILHACGQVTVLATSREPLGVDGEVTWRVPSLSLPSGPGLDAVAASESGRLFADRAARVRPGFTLTDDNAAAVAEVCARVDGIPLAIELAAARVRVMTPDQIVDGLQDRFRLLTGGARSALPRQRTLEASVEWSHSLLDDDERIVLRRLGAFAGTFTLDGAEAVAGGGGIDQHRILDLVTRLVDRSLVQVSDEGIQARYRLLETIRDDARRRLLDSDEADVVYDRHLDFYCRAAAEAAPHLVGPRSTEWLRRLDLDIDDLRRAMEWSPRSADPARALGLAADLHWYWRARAPQEGRSRIVALLDLPGADLADRGRALVSLAAVEMVAGEVPAARRHAQEALDIGRDGADDRTVGRALSFLGWTTTLGGPDTTLAPGLLADAVHASRAAGDQPYTALSLNALGYAHIGTSTSAQARSHLQAGMRLAERIGYDRPLMEGNLWLGMLDLVEGRYAAASDHLTTVLDEEDWRWDTLFRSIARSMLAEVLTSLGHHDEADDQLAAGLAEATADRDAFGEAQLRRALAWLRYVQGDLAAAERELDLAAGPLSVTHAREAARCAALGALVSAAAGDLDRARSRADRALDQARATDYVRALAPAHEAVGLTERARGEPGGAEHAFHDMLAVSARTGHRPGVCDALEGLAGALGAASHHDEAARLYGAADALRRSMDHAAAPVLHDDRRRDRQATRTALGADVFDARWTEGANLSADDAVAYAQRGRGERRRPPHGWASLTPAEQKVVALVTEGLTNPQIGQRLFVSPRTVQSHLRHIFDKLAVTTRAELAAKAATTPAHHPPTALTAVAPGPAVSRTGCGPGPGARGRRAANRTRRPATAGPRR